MADDLAVSYLFEVHIDPVGGLSSLPAARFTKVSGLSARYDVLKVKEGGENSYTQNLPGRLEYDNVQLTRPVDETSGVWASWFVSLTSVLASLSPHQALQTMGIHALSPTGDVVATWVLNGVTPVSYKGPNFGVDDLLSVPQETFEFAHNGFLNVGGAGL